jgi:2-polyprenyl-6-methoxyphenol hydroxylase-like FAD-dependent oxidoreductase
LYFTERVSGAGIGGLALSSTLGLLEVGPEIKIDIYEASSHISEIGAGIDMWKRTWEILRSIALGDTLLKVLPRPPDDVSRACHISCSSISSYFPVLLMESKYKQLSTLYCHLAAEL